jgi:hypothetical protein
MFTDHRYASAMQTDMLCRARRELIACGVLRNHDIQLSVTG